MPGANLETVVSKETEQARVVRGNKKGASGKLRTRDKERNLCVLSIDGKKMEFSLDDVCEFVV